MPRDSGGVYSLPAGYLAVTGETIQASQHNPPLEDLAAAMTGSLPRTGAAPMTGPLRLADGSSTVPALSFASDPTKGFYKTALGFIVTGMLNATPIGGGMDYWGTTAPAGWLFPYGQAISRTTYAALFAVLGTTYGAGDGSTTFNLPDKRDRASFGKGDMGGTGAGRITGVPAGGWVGTTLGAAGGAQSHQLVAAELPTITPTTASITQPAFNRAIAGIAATSTGDGGGAFTAITAITNTDQDAPRTQNVAVTMNSFGSNGAHNNLPPGIVCNYIIFAGA